MKDLFTLAAPFGLEAGYRYHRLYAGAFGTIAPTSATCGLISVHCTRMVYDAALEVRLYFVDTPWVESWLGAGVGWEVATVSYSGAAGTASGALGGYAFPLEIGVDGKTGPVTVGIFTSLTLAWFVTQSETPQPVGFRGSVGNASPHEWTTFGIRVGYDGFVRARK